MMERGDGRVYEAVDVKGKEQEKTKIYNLI